MSIVSSDRVQRTAMDGIPAIRFLAQICAQKALSRPREGRAGHERISARGYRERDMLHLEIDEP